MAVDSRRRATPKATRRLGPTGLVAALVPLVLCAILSLWEPFGVRALRDLEFDIFQRWSPRVYDPESPIRVVAVDDESLQRLGQWPWPRVELAALIDKLTAAGAAAVVLDVLFAEPERASASEAEGDRVLAEAIGRGKLVLGMAFAEHGAKPIVKAGFASIPAVLHRCAVAARCAPRTGDRSRRDEFRARPGPRRARAANGLQRRRTACPKPVGGGAARCTRRLYVRDPHRAAKQVRQLPAPPSGGHDNVHSQSFFSQALRHEAG